MSEPGIDYAFLRYIGATPEGQKRIQSFYLPFFAGCQKVVDLGCGDGDFVELLKEKGIEGIGVDRDEKCCAAARQRNLNVVCQDVFVYLQGLDKESVDGIFSAHLVEHLPYERVLELLRLSWRALRRGGVIVLATPNVRGLFSHLEMFYMHFGHVTFYHPRLLCFLLEYTGFSNPTMGENPNTASPLLGKDPLGLQAHRAPGGQDLVSPVSYERELPLPNKDILRRLIKKGKTFLVRLIVQPYFDQIVAQVNRGFDQANEGFAQVARIFQQLDRPFECYVSAVKGDGQCPES